MEFLLTAEAFPIFNEEGGMCLYFLNILLMENIAFLSTSEMKMGNF